MQGYEFFIFSTMAVKAVVATKRKLQWKLGVRFFKAYIPYKLNKKLPDILSSQFSNIFRIIIDSIYLNIYSQVLETIKGFTTSQEFSQPHFLKCRAFCNYIIIEV
jgi:hypothetical protein